MSESESESSFQRQPRGWGDLLALTVWTVALLAFFWDLVRGRRALFYFDISEINLPYRDFLATEIRSGRFSRWHPGLYCGLPIFSESQAGYFHPFKYLFCPWLPSWLALSLETIFSIWLAGVVTFGWLRRHVGPVGALTGAGVYGLSGFMWSHFVHTSWLNALQGLPLAFWALEVTWQGGRIRGVGLGAMSLACQIFAGQVQSALMTGLALMFYALYRATFELTMRGRNFVLKSVLLLVTLGALIAAVQWVPSKELLDRSPRAGGLTREDLTFGSWHPELLPTLFLREIYGTRAADTDWMDLYYPYHEMNISVGVIALALALIATHAYRDRWVGFFLIFAGLGGLMMLGRYTFLFDFMHRVPILGSSRIPVRYDMWVSFAVAALAAVGADTLAKPGRVRWRRPALIWVGLFLISMCLVISVYSPLWRSIAKWPGPNQRTRMGWLITEVGWGVARSTLSLLAFALILTVRGRVTKPFALKVTTALVPIIVISELFGIHWRDVPTIEPAYWTEPPASVAWLKGQSDLGRIFGIPGPMANAPGYASRPVNYFPARDALAWNLAPVWGLHSSSGETPIYPRRMLHYTDRVQLGAGRFDIEGVSHVLTGGPRIPGLGTPERVEAAMIYRNPTAQPRVRLMGRPIYAQNEDDAADQLTKHGALLRDRALVEDPDRPLNENDRTDPTATAILEIDQPEHIEIATHSTQPAYLVLADTFDPGWSATVDGRAMPIRPAFVAFRAVFLPAGQHQVVFRYVPAGFKTGLALTSLGLLLTIVLLVWPFRSVALEPAHGPSGWPWWWPITAIVLVAVILTLSIIRIDSSGRLGLQSRWSNSFHQWAWSGKINSTPTSL